RLAAELQDRLHELIGAAGAHRMTASLETAERADRQIALERQAPLRRQLQSAAAVGEAARLESEHRDDREGVVRLEQIDVARADRRLPAGPTRRVGHRLPDERVLALGETQGVGGAGGAGDAHRSAAGALRLDGGTDE